MGEDIETRIEFEFNEELDLHRIGEFRLKDGVKEINYRSNIRFDKTRGENLSIINY